MKNDGLLVQYAETVEAGLRAMLDDGMTKAEIAARLEVTAAALDAYLNGLVIPPMRVRRILFGYIKGC